MKVSQAERIVMRECDFKLPLNVEKWVEKTVFKNKFYFYFKKHARNNYTGCCQHCGKENIVVDHPKHLQYGKCPHCGGKVQFRNAKFNTNISDDEHIGYMFQTENGMYIYRKFQVFKHSKGIKFSISMREKERHIFELHKGHYIFHHSFCSENWLPGGYSSMHGYTPDAIWLYPGTLKSIEKNNERLKYSMLYKMAKHIYIEPRTYLETYLLMPKIELFVKAGLYNIAFAASHWGDIHYKLRNDDFKTVIGLKSRYLKYAKLHDCNYDQIKALQIIQEQKLQPNKNLINFVNNLRNYKDFISKYMPLQAFYKYSHSQKFKRVTEFANDYRDYLDACKYLKYDLKDTMILKPKDFKSAHDRACELKVNLQNEASNKQFIESCKTFKKFEFIGKDLIVKLPANIYELKVEGQALHHCVGSYVDRIIDKKCVIVFIRQKSDVNKPFYTMELTTSGKLVQCRTLNNNSYLTNKKILNFVNKYLTNIKKQIFKVA